MPTTRSPRPRSPALLKDEQVEQEMATVSTVFLLVQLARLGKGFHHNKYKNTKNNKGERTNGQTSGRVVALEGNALPGGGRGVGEVRRVIQSTVAKRKEEATEGSARAPLLASTVVGVASCKGGWGRVVALAGRQDGGDGGGGSGAGPGGLARWRTQTPRTHWLSSTAASLAAAAAVGGGGASCPAARTATAHFFDLDTVPH